MLREGRSREKSHLLARIHETEARGHPAALMSPDQIKIVRSIVQCRGGKRLPSSRHSAFVTIGKITRTVRDWERSAVIRRRTRQHGIRPPELHSWVGQLDD